MKVPTGTAQSELEVKRSRFLSYACPVYDPDEVKSALEHLRREHPQASHLVYAFITGDNGTVMGMSDDHEPKNTAGRPALEVLKGSGITNVLVMIIRYFGGTKLGTGGLVKAYTEATQQVLTLLPTEESIPRVHFRLILPYNLYQQAQGILSDCDADELKEEFATEITISGRIPQERFSQASDLISDLSSGSRSLILCDF